tara:strand:- start:7064 stop:8659 length:1596 start_codon:yes stop_codon:yes gene_type:complete
MTDERPLCPKCKKKKMCRDGRTPGGKQRWSCKTQTPDGTVYCYNTTDPFSPYRGESKRPKTAPKPRKAFRKTIDPRQTLVFTAAQNATPVHEAFFGALETFCKHNDAELCIIPLRYKNPTSLFSENMKDDEYWAVPHEYLYEQRKKLNDNLLVLGDVKIQPTKVDPLTGVHGMTHGESGIFGHTKMRMKCVATPQNKMPKVLTTTGACTVANYTDTLAGKKGDFHHVLGAVVVQIESPTKYHIHHINARKSDGAFIFKTEYYDASGVKPAPPYEAVVFGDAHYRFADPRVVEATFGKGGLVETLNPAALVWHDLLDCYFGNPHHGENPFIRKAKHDANFHIAQDEVTETVAWLQKLTGDRLSYIVPSNHDDMFARWVVREDWKKLEPENMGFYLETALQMAKSAKMSEIGAQYLDPFQYWVNKLTGDDPRIVAMSTNEHLKIKDIECGYHGDKGPNGARGTVKNLSEIGSKVISGHGHTPEIRDGHYRTGTMTRLTAEYTHGPGSWLNTHCSIDALGKRHLHTCVDGKFFL